MKKTSLYVLFLPLSILLGSMADFRLHYSEAGYQSTTIEKTANAN
jgi:hypothetical protein